MVAIEDQSAPGTFQLIDADGHLHVKHSADAHDIVLVPRPSGNLFPFLSIDKSSRF